MKIFFFSFLVLFVNTGIFASNFPGVYQLLGVFNSTPASSTFTGVATNSIVEITIDPMENWPITLSAGEISVFDGSGGIPIAGTTPLSSTTSGSVSLSTSNPGAGTFYILFTWIGPPNRIVTVNGSSPAMPVTWLSVTAESKNKNVLVSWGTASEINNDFFTVEKSSDGQYWEEIRTVSGSRNSSTEKWYEFVDENPLPGINYYRIKQTDFDGKFSYSKVVDTTFDIAADVKVIAQNGNITVTSSEAIDITIFDASGRQIVNKNINFYEEITVAKTGIYFVKINGTTNKKVVVP